MTTKIQTFRYTFTKEFTEVLFQFAKVHQYDDRKIFKEEWNTWIKTDDINPLINEEIKKMNNDGFDGDVMDKMFKSARYYFRKKSTMPKDEKERKVYIGFTKTILEEMDKHILTQINANIKQKNDTLISDISPEDAYNIYCDENKPSIVKEMLLLHSKSASNSESGVQTLDSKEISDKFKKTYKNRFYMLKTNKT